MQVKHCFRCDQDKSHGDFYNDKARKDGLAPECKVCRNAMTRAWQVANKDRHYATVERWQGRQSVQRWLFRSAQLRASALGIPFTITEADIVVPEVCPVLGIRLVRHHRGGKGHDDSFSLDRVVPELGYVPGNIVVMSNRANRMKNNATPAEIEMLHLWAQAWVASRQARGLS
jgi:hypothetical protein